MPFKPDGSYRPSHADVLLQTQQYLALRGAWRFKVWGNMMTRKGVPDLLCCMAGQMVAIEIKVGRDALRPDQKREKLALEAAGALYIIAASVDDVEAALLTAGLIDSPALYHPLLVVTEEAPA